MALWTVTNGHSLGTFEERTSLEVSLPINDFDSIVKISGALPGGMRIADNKLVGTPFEVNALKEFNFVLRATKDNTFEDITLKMSITGADAPIWQTPEGSLAVGPNNSYYILDNTFLDFQLRVLDPDIVTGEELTFWIATGDGELPPGLELTTDGRIQGIVEPILALEKRAGLGRFDENDFSAFPYDFGIKSANGFDSYYYDTQFYDLSIPTLSPKKLNRYYEFTVSVTDGVVINKRTFKIFLVGDDFLRSDNTIMQVANGLFSADNTYLRNPVWLTPSDLGYRRANNYVTLYLDTYDPNSLTGVTSYILQELNDDNTTSELPPGMELDSISGEVTGRVPYQPAITKEYKFTVNAIRQVGTLSATEVSYKLYDNKSLYGGSKFVNITKTPGNDIALITQLRDKRQIYAEVQGYTQLKDYDILTLKSPLKSNNSLQTLACVAGQNTIKVKNPTTTEVNGIWYDGVREQVFSGLRIENDPVEGRIGVITLEQNLSTSIPEDTILYYGKVVDKDVTFSNTLTEATVDQAEKKKTFTVKLLGEVDSTIKWLTAPSLGTLRANFISTLSVVAETTVPNANLYYTLVNGKLPPGLNLSIDGEIVGKINQFGTEASPGLTVFDNKTTSFDGGNTTIDRKYTFTIQAKDQFGFSAIERTFTLSTIDPDDILYSNIIMKPFLKQDQKLLFTNFISNPNVFDPNLIYRPNDSQFGLQTEVKSLAFAGIETKSVDQYVSAIAKNHKKKKFKIGEVKTAIAKYPGSNDIIYEVVYVELIDPQDHIDGTRNSIEIQTQNKITVDSVALEPQDDLTGLGTGFTTFDIGGRGDAIATQTAGGQVTIFTRDGPIVLEEGEAITILLRDATNVDVADISKGINADPYRFRPDQNTIKADSNAILTSDAKDKRKYISNISNMRQRIREVGVTEREFLPLWMRTSQRRGESELGYTPSIPLCYCKPGTSSTIALNIKNSGFDFSQLDFEIDRYIIDSTTGKGEEQYLLFANYQFNV